MCASGYDVLNYLGACREIKELAELYKLPVSFMVAEEGAIVLLEPQAPLRMVGRTRTA